MRVHIVKKARKDIEGTGIKKGESYYWWKFRYGGKICSKNYPKRSQLTRSEYLAGAYDIDDMIQASTSENLSDNISSAISDLENLKETAEEKLSNMPEQLQSSNSGSILSEYIDQFDSWISALEGIDEIDEDEIRREAENEVEGIDEAELRREADAEIREADPQEEDEDNSDYLARISSDVEDKFQEKLASAKEIRDVEIESLTEEKIQEALTAALEEAVSPF